MEQTDGILMFYRRLVRDETNWLTEQLRIAWERLDELRNRIDGAGSLMDSGHVASAIGYVSNTREGDA
ncbi:hypothetical protein ACFXPY_34150 [Streptomyces sp. NPDC059153]|uniref:hypothetical protein n=1 Tax=unclassified Streptomyces TaxID=2593676 RepID=UPI003629D9DD